jgi:hypothetical protein
MLHRSTVFFPNTYSNSDFPKTKWQNEKRTKEQTTIYKALHIKLKDRVTRTPLNTGVNIGAPEWLAVPVPLVAPVLTRAMHTWYIRNDTIILSKENNPDRNEKQLIISDCLFHF